MNNVLFLLQQNVFLVVIAITGLIGCMAYSMAGKGLAELYEETQSMTTSNHNFIKQLKLRRENGMRINIKMRNTYAFVMKHMDKYRYLNLAIRDYVKMAWLIQLVCIMLGLIGGVINQNVWYAAYGCVCALAVNCVGKIEDIDRREQQVIVNIMDYFDNILTFDKKVVESQENLDYNIERISGNEKEDGKHQSNSAGYSPALSKADMGQLAAREDSLAKAEPKELGEGSEISEEQRRLIEDVLREYLT